MAAQKTKRTKMAWSMPQMLESHPDSKFHFLRTSDESLMFYDCHHTGFDQIWLPRDEAPETRDSHMISPGKLIVTIA
jgi:hypothetical protein